MTEKQYEVHIHQKAYTQKPSLNDVKNDINHHVVDYVSKVTQKELAVQIGQQGRSCVLAVMNGKRLQKNMVKQQVFALDFDNTELSNGKKVRASTNNYTSITSILDNPFIKEHASFIYKTFSYQKDWEKFRVIFFMDQPVVNNTQVEIVYDYLMSLFPTADKAAKDSSRIFFGGTEVIEIRYGNELKANDIEVPDKFKASKKVKNKAIVAISKSKSDKMMRSYIKREKELLNDYGNALSAIFCIGKAAKTGEISEDSAFEYVEWLAGDNQKWQKENIIKLTEVLQTPVNDIRTEYTFQEKFGSPKSKDIDVIKLSKQLVKELDIKLFHDALYFKDGKRWITNENKLLRATDKYQELKKSQDNELIAQFYKRSELLETDYFPVQFENGYQLENGEISKSEQETFSPYLLNVTYDPKAYSRDVDEFLNFFTVNRQDVRMIIEEMLGHLLMIRGFPHKVFFFVSEKGNNGKSTFLEMLNSFVGDLGTNIALEDFNDATSLVELEGKLLNVGDDIDAAYLDKSKNFKTVAAGNTIMIRPIYSPPYRLKNKATLVFSANKMPTFKDKTGGIERRLVIIPCDGDVKQIDFEIDAKLSTNEAKSYLLNLALSGLKRIQENGGRISSSEAVDNKLKEYLTDNDSILSYIDERDILDDVSVSETYANYVEYCKDLNVIPNSSPNFKNRLDRLGYKRTQIRRLGKRVWVYKKLEENELSTGNCV